MVSFQLVYALDDFLLDVYLSHEKLYLIINGGVVYIHGFHPLLSLSPHLLQIAPHLQRLPCALIQPFPQHLIFSGHFGAFLYVPFKLFHDFLLLCQFICLCFLIQHILSQSLAEFAEMAVMGLLLNCEGFHSFQLFLGSPYILVELFLLFLLYADLLDFTLQLSNLPSSLLDDLLNWWPLGITADVVVLDDVEELLAMQGYRLQLFDLHKVL